MKVDLTPEQREFVQVAIETGRLPREEEAVQEAMNLWVERERRRLVLLAALDDAEASLVEGEGHVITKDSMTALAEEVKERGLTHFATLRSGSD